MTQRNATSLDSPPFLPLAELRTRPAAETDEGRKRVKTKEKHGANTRCSLGEK